jgi:hypothetical protein
MDLSPISVTRKQRSFIGFPAARNLAAIAFIRVQWRLMTIFEKNTGVRFDGSPSWRISGLSVAQVKYGGKAKGAA